MIRMQWNPQARASRLNRGESGQAMVELAVTLPILMLIMLGAVEFARMSYGAIEVSNAARAAAQYAAMNGGAPGDTGGVTQAAQNDSLNLSWTPGTAVTSTVVSDTCECSGAGEGTAVACTATCPSGQRILETVLVTTSATYTPLLHLSNGFPGSFTLHGYAQQKVLQ